MAVDERLVELTWEEHQLIVALAYAGPGNLSGQPIYASARCLVRRETEACLRQAVRFAALCGTRLKVFDAYRPPAAQARLWQCVPDPRYVAAMGQGSNHSRGVAVDVTLVDAQGRDLDMGTPFDTMAEPSHHLAAGLPAQVHRNRFLLLGVMKLAGFLELEEEWWHYELPDARGFPVLQDGRVRCLAAAGNPGGAPC
jgi:zinc D-Ala-D-Ala dipeptidase